MQLPIDDRILETLSQSGLTLSPAIIAYNIDKSREEVTRRLSEMVDRDLVIREKRGYYSIADKGEAYLSGDVELDDKDDS
ncbi:transcriptional regulator [Salinibaculum salinum]|uniref:transcriptional regulator n=1 Tax=Salinibaculum salinum TaxID=3131996 RepID=UPI003A96ABFA